jgi:predicted CoA-binding protein
MIVPINVSLAREGGQIMGRKAVASVAEIDGEIEIVDIFDEQNPYYIPV